MLFQDLFIFGVITAKKLIHAPHGTAGNAVMTSAESAAYQWGYLFQF